MRSNEMQYWVIGGDYSDLNFTSVIAGTLQVSGPYTEKADAVQAWREHSQTSRYKATTRFTVAASPDALSAR